MKNFFKWLDKYITDQSQGVLALKEGNRRVKKESLYSNLYDGYTIFMTTTVPITVTNNGTVPSQEKTTQSLTPIR